MIPLFRSYAALDKTSRLKKAEKIIKVLSRYKSLERSEILDIGCGSGYLGSILAKLAKRCIGIDVVDERKVKNFKFIKTDALKIPFKPMSFDIIVCNHVIEHVTDQKKLLQKISSLLRKDGICYITCPNILWPMEPHLKLPFLSYLPKNIADLYVRSAGKGEEYDIYPMTYQKFTKKLKKLFSIENFTLEILKNPKYYGFNNNLYLILSHFPNYFLKLINYFLPNWIIIVKNKSTS